MSISAALFGLSMAEGVCEILDKIIETQFGGSLKDIYEGATQRLDAYQGEVPPNHDLEQALRAAQLISALALLAQYQRWRNGGPWDAAFVHAARGWLNGQIGLCPGLKSKTNTELTRELEGRLNPALAARSVADVRAALAQAQAQMWDELVAGAGKGHTRAPASNDFKAFFDGDGSAERPGWALVFAAFIREAMKKNANAATAFVTSRLAAVAPMLERIEARTQRIETKIDTLPDAMVALMEARGLFATAEAAGLERKTIIALARRLKPEEALDFDRAVIELENAVVIALDVIAKGERGTNEDAFVNGVLARVAELTRAGEFDAGSREVDAALAELEEGYGRRRIMLLEAGVEQDSLRRDAPAVARRVEAVVAVEHKGAAGRFSALRQRQDAFYQRGRDKGVNFDLEISIEIARLAIATARDADERGAALNDLALRSKRSGRARAGRRGSLRRSRPIARRWRNEPASAFRCNGR